ncbi:hypothetical protein QA648_17880 [Rhizobium sp. CB3171]|uniref:hypothetical protein n=1 Tax=Rhizobium sp. CB3171 TaxID=3039157 RepID=UPI0024B1DEB3|nr:hypothetical protein [Rhizobium sp. CB3171]WFU01947.1 hypothetical protein QA648_17880 [Rhizobium sp. CB3171]
MKRLLVCLLMAAGTCGTAHADGIPKFKDYPAKAYSGEEAPLRLNTPQAQQNGPRLRKAVEQPINFGGRYVFAQWGAGTQCDTGALINVATGEVHFLPFAACNWSGFSKPFEVRKNSRLLVVAGQVGETGAIGAHYFEFTGKEFKPVGENVKSLTSVEPAAGPTEPTADAEIAFPDNRSLDALSQAIVFAIHRPVFHKDWVSDTKIFGPVQAKKLANAFYVTSIRKTVEHQGSSYTLLYNTDVDLFAIIKVPPKGEPFAGFVPGQQISEELYKHADNPQYLANMLGIRQGVVRHFFDHFQDIKVLDELFTLYQVDEKRSLPVNKSMVSFAKLLSAKKPCREAFEKMLETAEFRFPDGKTSKDVGKFYLSIWFAQLENENGTVKVDGAAAFHDVATNRYGGYLIFDPQDTACKPTRLITNAF